MLCFLANERYLKISIIKNVLPFILQRTEKGNRKAEKSNRKAEKIGMKQSTKHFIFEKYLSSNVNPHANIPFFSVFAAFCCILKQS